MDEKQVEMGIKVEAEHEPTYEKIKKYYSDVKLWPSNSIVYKWIAEDHLNEISDYYTRLDKMEKEAKKLDVSTEKEPSESEEKTESKKYKSEASTKDIKVKHPEILEIPDNKKFYTMPISHYVKLSKEKGKKPVMTALLNLERWNKNDNPELSKKARDLIDRLKRNKEYSEL